MAKLHVLAPPFFFFRRRRDPIRGPVLTAGEVNYTGQEVYLGGGGELTDPPRSSEANDRASRQSILMFRYTHGQNFGAEDFLAKKHLIYPSAGSPAGSMSPDELRRNTRSATPVAYGSLIPEIGSAPYGLE